MIICQAFWFNKAAAGLHDFEEMCIFLRHWRTHCMSHVYRNTNAFVAFSRRVRKTLVPADCASTAEAKFYAWIKALRIVFAGMDPRHDLGMLKPAKDSL